MKKKARSGFTTGACAAAAAKAATALLLTKATTPGEVDIPLPDGRRVFFKLHDAGYRGGDNVGYASIIKDAGDDPDVTNGAEIRAEARFCLEGCGVEMNCPATTNNSILIKGGSGVGIVTKPGLSLPVREAAINPVPRQMIDAAVREALMEQFKQLKPFKQSKPFEPLKRFEQFEPATLASLIEITISVPNGEELAKKTLNQRLGILGGISILGTTGIVNPVSAEAWTATISSSMDVARAMGRAEAVLSTGRVSEKAHMTKFSFPEESYVMMGDYLEFAFCEAKAKGFTAVHLCAQWAKMLKIAMATPQTHVKHGVIDMVRTVDFLKGLGLQISQEHQFNTAREIFYLIRSASADASPAFVKVCSAARKYVETIIPLVPLSVHLVSYEGEIIASN